MFQCGLVICLLPSLGLLGKRIAKEIRKYIVCQLGWGSKLSCCAPLPRGERCQASHRVSNIVLRSIQIPVAFFSFIKNAIV